MKKKPYILQVCGLKNTGKTTFMNGFTSYLKEKGYIVGTVKHDGHEFQTTHYTEDNFQHYHAGADTSIVFSDGQWLQIQREKRTLESFIADLQEMDIILIEGCKKEEYPKVELLRTGISEIPVSNEIGRLACIIDETYQTYQTYCGNETYLCKQDTKLFDKVLKLLLNHGK